MAADSVGQIGLDLVVNDKNFKKQMSGIQGMAKKAGLALAAAFSVKKLADFSAQCIQLGSDLEEVQNVVNVTFPKMSKQIDAFAKNAAVQFGLSETMAKKFTGTFGAMSKAFGFGEKQAHDMATTLTGLAGDVASFYNLSQDEAYTKLKSVFTGETESLKDLGVVMTQTALDSYALANGFGKTTKNMSEMEKVALRYKFVQDQLSLAAGDFSRTSDGWANQVRILKLQFDSLKATIGQGLINVLTPVIKVINTIIGKLMSLANAFKAFTEMLTGKKSGAAATASGLDAVAKSADKAGGAVSGTGNAAKKAAKDLKGVTTGIDELNIISTPDETGSGGGSDVGGYDTESFDMGEVDTSALDEMDSKYQMLIDRMKELAGLVKQGFWDGFGDTTVFDSIQNSIDSIKKSLKNIFTASEVINAANRFADAVAYNLGKVAGSAASIGATIADNLLGGLALYLEGNASRIKEYLVSMFDIGSRRAEIYGNFTAAIADIFTVFRGDRAKQITADIISVFAGGFMGVGQLAASFGTDLLDLITAPLIENAGVFKEAFQGILDTVQTVTGTIADLVSETVDKVLQLYDEHIHPLFESLKNGFAEIVGVVLDAFNTHVLPVFENAAQKFNEFSSTVLQPLIDKFLEFAGKVIDAVSALWNGYLQPFIEWLVSSMAPVIASVMQALNDTIFSFAQMFGEIITAILTLLSGVIDFLVGVFTGDWSLAWEGVKGIFSGIWESIKAIASGAVNVIKNVISLAWTAISKVTQAIWAGIKAFIAGIIHEIQSNIDVVLTKIKATWESIWTSVKTTTLNIFNSMWAGIKKVINTIISGVETMVNSVIKGLNKMIKALNNLSFEIPDWVPGLGGKSFGLHIPSISQISIPRLAQGGYVRANTPQLAMIGDNRRYGEIVAPEDKMQDMVNRAVALAGDRENMSVQYLVVMIELLKKIIELIENLDLTVNIDIREIRNKLKELEKRSGYQLRT